MDENGMELHGKAAPGEVECIYAGWLLLDPQEGCSTGQYSVENQMKSPFR